MIRVPLVSKLKFLLALFPVNLVLVLSTKLKPGDSRNTALCCKVSFLFRSWLFIFFELVLQRSNYSRLNKRLPWTADLQKAF